MVGFLFAFVVVFVVVVAAVGWLGFFKIIIISSGLLFHQRMEYKGRVYLEIDSH